MRLLSPCVPLFILSSCLSRVYQVDFLNFFPVSTAIVIRTLKVIEMSMFFFIMMIEKAANLKNNKCKILKKNQSTARGLNAPLWRLIHFLFISTDSVIGWIKHAWALSICQSTLDWIIQHGVSNCVCVCVSVTPECSRPSPSITGHYVLTTVSVIRLNVRSDQLPVHLLPTCSPRWSDHFCAPSQPR